MMVRSLIRAALLAVTLLAAQSCFADPVPVPAAKGDYVGDWAGDRMRLNIQKDGRIQYKRERTGGKIDLTIELQAFDGDNFEAGTSFIHSTFVVSKPPHREQGKWRMTVDGVELTRAE